MDTKLRLHRSEAIRILSTYARLITGFFIGLVLVRQLLSYGIDTFNIYTIVTIGAGVGIMLRELLRIALVPQLSAAYHKANSTTSVTFANVYTTSYLLSVSAALFGSVLMIILALNLYRFSINETNLVAAKIFIFCRMAIMFITVGLSPLICMLPVKQKFKESNFLLFVERLIDLVAVLTPVALSSLIDNPPIVIFGFTGAVLITILYIFVTKRMIQSDPNLSLSLSNISIKSMWKMLGLLKWAGLLVFSVGLYIRFNTLFVNLTFGAIATASFGIAVQLTGMVRQITNGIVHGLDAVIAKSHAGDRSNIDYRSDIIAFASRIQTTVTSFALVYLVFCLDDLLLIWLGGSVTQNELISLAAILTKIMLVGLTIKAISEVWMNDLNGTMDIDRYVRFLVPIAILNPIILIGIHTIDPTLLSPKAVTYIYTLLMVIAHAIIIPRVYILIRNSDFKRLITPCAKGVVSPILCAFTLAIISSKLGGGISKLVYVSLISLLFLSLDLINKIRRFRKYS